MVLDRLLGSRAATPAEKLLYVIDTSGSDGHLQGRKKLSKLGFFVEHWLPEEDALRPEPTYGGFDFAIYTHGPFSKELFVAFDELTDAGLVTESRLPGGPSRIRVTADGQRRLRAVESRLDHGARTRVEAVRERFSDMTGVELEAASLDYLGMTPAETREYMGMPVNVLVSERR